MWEDARLAKEALSRQTTAGIFVPLVERDVHVTREQFESGARAALTRTAQVTMSAIRQARITPADVAGLFLVGGSTRVPMVATVLHQQVGLAPIALEQPEIVVAEGALHHRAAAPAAAPAGAYPPAAPVSGDPGGTGPASGIPDGSTPMSAPPGAASPVSAPVPASPVPDVSTPPGGDGPPSPGVPARPTRTHRRLAVVLGICAAVLVVLLVAAGLTYHKLTTPRALPADLHAHACRYIDMTPLYTKFGVAQPKAAPVSHREFKLYTECTLNTSNRRKGIDITKVVFDVEPYANETSDQYAYHVTAMRKNDRYPVTTLSIGDEAAIGPLPNYVAASGSGSDYDPGPGLQIVVRKADYLLTIEVDLEINNNVQYEGDPRPTIPRHRLDTEADALAQTARTSLTKVSAAMQ